MSDKVSFIVPCMGRLWHLKRTIGSAVSHPDSEYVLVDWSCPDECGKWARENHPGIKVVQIPGQQYFNMSRSRNEGAKKASSDWLCFLDADMILRHDFLEECRKLMSEGVFVNFNMRNLPMDGYSGMNLCQAKDFWGIGGYDAEMEGWGHEDTDMRERLLLSGVKVAHVSLSLAIHIDHGDEERVLHYQEKDKRKSEAANKAIGKEKRL